jgi:hypothetical protein
MADAQFQRRVTPHCCPGFLGTNLEVPYSGTGAVRSGLTSYEVGGSGSSLV